MALTKVTLTGTKDTIKAAWTKFNDLIDDLLSTANGLGASQIGIEDTAGNMAATNVEDGLAEVYTDTSGSRSIANGFEEDSATTTGLTWGYQAGAIRNGNTVTNVIAGTIALTDDSENYIQINSSGVISKSTTSFTPDKVPLRQITAASGAQTVSTDKRCWFSSSYWQMLNFRGLKRAKFVWVESLDYDGGTVIFVEGETVTGAGGATGVVEHIVGDATSGTLYLKTRNSTAYIDDEAITGSGTGAAVANGASSKNALVIYPGAYYHNGTSEQIVYWTSKISYEFTSLGNPDISYLYLDDSAIVTSGSPVITSTQLTDSITEPIESISKNGFYNGNDKCIFAVYSGGGNMSEFDHSDNLVRIRVETAVLTDGDIDNAAWTDVDCSAIVPVFSEIIEAQVKLDILTADAEVYLRTRPKGSNLGGHVVVLGTRTGTDVAFVSPTQISTNSSQVFQINCSRDGADLGSVTRSAWYLPINV